MFYREDEVVVEFFVDVINVFNYKFWGFELIYWWLRYDKKFK